MIELQTSVCLENACAHLDSGRDEFVSFGKTKFRSNLPLYFT